MAKAVELARRGERLERLSLEHVVEPHRFEGTRLHDQEAPVHPVLKAELLDKAGDPAPYLRLGRRPRTGRAYEGHGLRTSMRAVEGEQRMESMSATPSA